jgi:hypothetical protein
MVDLRQDVGGLFLGAAAAILGRDAGKEGEAVGDDDAAQPGALLVTGDHVEGYPSWGVARMGLRRRKKGKMGSVGAFYINPGSPRSLPSTRRL